MIIMINNNHDTLLPFVDTHEAVPYLHIFKMKLIHLIFTSYRSYFQLLNSIKCNERT